MNETTLQPTLISRIDEYGRGGWIALMVLGFIMFWPIGLAMLAYLLASGRLKRRWNGVAEFDRNMQEKWEKKMFKMQTKCGWSGNGRAASRFSPTGNAAFDEYREATLKRLEDEAKEFQDYLGRLRMARDKAEFDQYMSERRAGGGAPGGAGPLAA